MKSITKLALAIVCLLSIGCNDFKEKPNGFYHLNVESIEQSKDHYSAVIKLETVGKVKIILKEDNGRSSFYLTPNQKTNTNECELRFDAKLSEKDGYLEVTSLAQIRTDTGTKAGGPSTYYPNPIEEKKKVTDFLEITNQSDKHPIGKELQIGTSHGQPILLMVEEI